MLSKSLIRTNPRLTGNLKIVTDNNLVWLESFDTDPNLSSIDYKHFPVPKTEKLQFQISKFWKNADRNTIFDIPSNSDASIFRTDFNQQYLPIYWAGPQYTEDSYYKQPFEYLAPLLIDPKNIPTAFIIFRLDGASNIDASPSHWNVNVTSAWKIVSYFPMDPSTPIGQILNTMYSDKSVPYSVLNIDYTPTVLSQISGIDVVNGGFVSNYFPLGDETTTERTTYDMEEFVTSQFYTNNLCHPFLFNIKWLFNDAPSLPLSENPWSINTYFGFYVNDLEYITSWTMDNGTATLNGLSQGGAIINGNLSNLSSIRSDDTIIISLNSVFYAASYQGGELFVNSDALLNSSNTGFTSKSRNITTTVAWNTTNNTIKLYRLNFTDIHDIDMERMETDFANFEYNSQNKLSSSLEPKQYLALGVTTDIDPSRTQPDFTYGMAYEGEDFRSISKPIPVSSEYTSDLDTISILNSKLKDIWNRTPWSSKWGFVDSNNTGEIPYRISNALTSGLFNRGVDCINNVLTRSSRTLDWFYTNSGNGTWDFSSLHLDNPNFINFDVNELAGIAPPSDQYNDYLQWVFGQQRTLTTGNTNPNRWAYFGIGTDTEIPTAIFKGIKFSLGQVVRDSTAYGITLDDSLNGYRISSLFSQRPKWKLDENGNTIIDTNIPFNLQNNNPANWEMGIDIIRDDRSKSIVIWLWVLIENRNGNGYYFPVTPISMDNTERDNYYVATNWAQLLFDGIRRPSTLPSDINYFSPFQLTASSFATSLNNIGMVNTYKGGIRNCTVNTGTILYENPSNSSWRLFVENPEYLAINTWERTYSSNTIDPKQINYSLTNILAKGSGYVGNVPAPDIYYSQPGILTLSSGKTTGSGNIYRHIGHYDIITKSINLWTKEESYGSYFFKKWDYSLKDWGLSTEWIWSKTSRGGINTKPLSDTTTPLYVIIDEYGYDWGKRNILTGSWGQNFYMEYEPINLGINDSDIRKEY